MPMATAKDNAAKDVRRLKDWRKDAWLALGYKEPWADFLAGTQIDIHHAGKLLDQGATHDQVVRILAGYGPLGMDSTYDWTTHDRVVLGIEPEPEVDEEQVEEDEEHVAVAAGEAGVGRD